MIIIIIIFLTSLLVLGLFDLEKRVEQRLAIINMVSLLLIMYMMFSYIYEKFNIILRY